MKAPLAASLDGPTICSKRCNGSLMCNIGTRFGRRWTNGSGRRLKMPATTTPSFQEVPMMKRLMLGLIALIALMATSARILPYALSWSALAVLMIVGMNRLPFGLYGPVDGDWAKWNVEAMLHFSKIFDLSPYSMLAGMGSMYLPNLPWLNPGAFALALPLVGNAQNIASYAIYAAELAVSIVLLARVIGFSWLMATAGAQLYLYLMFPPFCEVFQIYPQYTLAPYYAHLTAVLNGATAVLLACGRTRDWRRNVALCVAFLILFISGLLSAPISFIFATPAYMAISAVVILARRPAHTEWAWKAAALLLCLVFFLASGLPSYYLGTMATAARTPPSPIAWDNILSIGAWLQLFRTHSLCQDTRFLLCPSAKGAWVEIAALVGAAIAVLTRGGDMRSAGTALLAYVGLTHIYAYAYQVGWLGLLSVLSTHFLMLSCWTFVCMFAVVPFFELFRFIKAASGGPAGYRQVARFLGSVGFAAFLLVITVNLLRDPFVHDRYRPVQLLVAAVAIGIIVVTLHLLRVHAINARASSASTTWRRAVALSAFPILALVHLSFDIRAAASPARDQSLENYLRERIAIDVGKPFRGYAATIWVDDREGADARPVELIHGMDPIKYYLNRFDETFYLWRANIPTVEEYGQWTSAQAHAFAQRLLGADTGRVHINYLRAFTFDRDILRLLGVRFIVTNAQTLRDPAMLRGSVASPAASTVRLFEFTDPNLGTYSPTQFVKAATADQIAQRIRENKDRLDQVAVVTDDLPPTTAQARDVVMTVERDGVRIQATSDGPTHILLPLQFSHCLIVVNDPGARLSRANLFQTLMSFDRVVDARIEFRFGLFVDNGCRLRDGLDNKALGL
jgi:hypothetical protein